MKKRWIAFSILIGTIVLGFGSGAAFRFKWQHEFDRRLDELAGQGHPVSLDDIEAAAALPDGVPNAADVYIKAFDAYVEPTEEQKALLPLRGTFEHTANEPLPAEVIKAIRITLEANAQTLELLDAGAQIEQCRYPRVRDGHMMNNVHYDSIRECAKLLIERVLYLSATDQNGKAVEACLISLKFAASLKRETYLIDYLVKDAMLFLNCDNIDDILSWIELPEKELLLLQSQIAQLHDPQGFQAALINERAVGVEFARQRCKQAGSYSSFADIADRLYRMSGFETAEVNMMLDYLEEYINAVELPVGKNIAEYERISNGITAIAPYSMYLSEVFFYTKIGKLDLRVAGYLRCVETSLAIERYRLKYRALPETLEKIVPEFMAAVPIDPIDGMPLRYVLNDIGYTVYTIGDDGVDNGGLTNEQVEQITPGSGECDFPFTVTR